MLLLGVAVVAVLLLLVIGNSGLLFDLVTLGLIDYGGRSSLYSPLLEPGVLVGTS